MGLNTGMSRCTCITRFSAHFKSNWVGVGVCSTHDILHLVSGSFEVGSYADAPTVRKPGRGGALLVAVYC